MGIPVVAILGALLAAALGAREAEAATLDCARPSLPLEKLICGDPLLRAADAEENAVYDSALLASLDRAALRGEERDWFATQILPYNWFAERGAPTDNAKIVATYRRRADTLRQETKAWREFRHNVPGAMLATTCLALPRYHPGEGCEVDAFNPVEGDPSLRYQIQNYAGLAKSAVVVLARSDGDGWLPIVVAHGDIAYFAAPRVIEASAGKLLLLPGTGRGTAQENESALYRFEHGTLQEIDDKSWLEGLGAKLPKGLGWDHGIFPDYAKMAAETALSRPGDPNCCPTGGFVRIEIAIENDTVVLKSVTPETAPSVSGVHAN